ncbi:lysozyme inhibitor LprI family protein [Neorhizobium turbinariae]
MRSIVTALALTGLAAVPLPQMASAASFDCERADLAPDEKMICDNRSLNDADVKMVTTFDILTTLVAMGNRDKLKEEQSAWLKKRQACSEDVACLQEAYAERMKKLDEAFNDITRPL